MPSQSPEAASLLPPGYAQLEPFVADWALPTTFARAEKRGASTPLERQAFYDAVQPVAAQAMAGLESKPLEHLSEAENRLLNLLLTFAHVSLAVEIQGKAEEEHSRWRKRMVITRSAADA